MSHSLRGNIRIIGAEQRFPSGFSKREFVVTTDEKFPQDIKLELVKDKCRQLDKFRAGDLVEVQFNIRGNEHDGRFYVSLVAWKLEQQEGEAAPPAQRPLYQPPTSSAAPVSPASSAPSRQAPATQPRAPARQSSFYGEEESHDDVPF